MRRIAKQFARNGDASLFPSPSEPASLGLRKKAARFLAQCFLIWEIPTGVVRCVVPADGDGNMPAERVAGMLAMHCLALNRRLEDFQVLVLPLSSWPRKVTERAKQLIAAGCSIGAETKLSSCERAVLDGILRNLSNKEIASELKVTVRTIKFHVSSLLAKFDVPNRAALGQQIAVAQIVRSGSTNWCAEAGTDPQPGPDRRGEQCLAVSQVGDLR